MAYAYTGAWMRGVSTYTDQGDVQHTADPSHQTNMVPNPGTAPGNFQQTPQAADMSGVASEIELTQYPGMDWYFQDTTQVPYQVNPSHETQGTHDTNDGAGAAIYARPGPLQYTDEHFLATHTETGAYAPSGPDGGQDGFVKSSFRGLNALQENNPEGFRNGYDNNFTTKRKFNVGERIHLHRPLAPNIIFDPTVVPGNTNSPYGHVYASNTKFQSVEVPTSYQPVTPPANFDAGMVTTPDGNGLSPVVGW